MKPLSSFFRYSSPSITSKLGDHRAVDPRPLEHPADSFCRDCFLSPSDQGLDGQHVSAFSYWALVWEQSQAIFSFFFLKKEDLYSNKKIQLCSLRRTTPTTTFLDRPLTKLYPTTWNEVHVDEAIKDDRGTKTLGWKVWHNVVHHTE